MLVEPGQDDKGHVVDQCPDHHAEPTDVGEGKTGHPAIRAAIHLESPVHGRGVGGQRLVGEDDSFRGARRTARGQHQGVALFDVTTHVEVGGQFGPGPFGQTRVDGPGRVAALPDALQCRNERRSGFFVERDQPGHRRPMVGPPTRPGEICAASVSGRVPGSVGIYGLHG